MANSNINPNTTYPKSYTRSNKKKSTLQENPSVRKAKIPNLPVSIQKLESLGLQKMIFRDLTNRQTPESTKKDSYLETVIELMCDLESHGTPKDTIRYAVETFCKNKLYRDNWDCGIRLGLCTPIHPPRDELRRLTMEEVKEMYAPTHPPRKDL